MRQKRSMLHYNYDAEGVPLGREMAQALTLC